MSEIIEYAYDADTYGPCHVLRAIGKRQLPKKTVEETLAFYAAKQGLNWDKQDFDSNGFPARGALDSGIDELHYGQMCGEIGVIERMTGDGQPHCYARCAICHEPLGGYCPQMDAITEAEATARGYKESWPSFTAWREQNGDSGTLREYEEAAWQAYCAQDEETEESPTGRLERGGPNMQSFDPRHEQMRENGIF